MKALCLLCPVPAVGKGQHRVYLYSTSVCQKQCGKQQFMNNGKRLMTSVDDPKLVTNNFTIYSHVSCCIYIESRPIFGSFPGMGEGIWEIVHTCGKILVKPLAVYRIVSVEVSLHVGELSFGNSLLCM